MARFRDTYVTPLWRWLRTLLGIWLVANVLIATAVHIYGRPVSLQRADVIIVLGSGLNRDGSAGTTLTRRSIHAAALWKAGYARVVLCTGGQTKGFRQSEASACRDVLLANGVTDGAVHLEDRSHSTEENAIHSRHIMLAQGWHTSLLVTDPFHMLRATWIFGDYGIAHVSAPVPADRIARGWYFNRLGREVIALQWQGLKKLLRLSVTSVPAA